MNQHLLQKIKNVIEKREEISWLSVSKE
jgi:hypothetical protein